MWFENAIEMLIMNGAIQQQALYKDKSMYFASQKIDHKIHNLFHSLNNIIIKLIK